MQHQGGQRGAGRGDGRGRVSEQVWLVGAGLLCCAGLLSACTESHRAASADEAAEDELGTDTSPYAGPGDVPGYVPAYHPGYQQGDDQGYDPSYVEPATTTCGAPEPGLPVLLGLGEREVWLQAIGEEPTLVHRFDADDPAFDGLEGPLQPWRAGEHVVVTAGGVRTYLGVGAMSRVLFTRRGQVLWSKSWPKDAGGEVRGVGDDGTLLLETGSRYSMITADGEERQLAAGFTPFAPPDAEGWMGGVFSEGEDVTGYGFQHARTDERRLLARDARRGALDVGWPELRDGRFAYPFIDADGTVLIAIEGPDDETLLPLEGETLLPELVPGATKTIVHRQGRPIALLDRTRAELTRVEVPDLGDESLYMTVDGDWVVGVVSGPVPPFDPVGTLRTSLVERRYRLHVPSGRIDTLALPPLPEGKRLHDDPSCYGGWRGSSLNGRMVVQLAPADAADPAPGQFHVESDDGSEWLPLGEEVYFGLGTGAGQVDDRWLLSTMDARNTYCAQPLVLGDPDSVPADALQGYTTQIATLDETLLAVDATEVSLTLSADGSCALSASETENTLHELTDERTHAIDFPTSRLLYPLELAYGGW